MSQVHVLEHAQKGDLNAISFLINRSLHKQGVRATIDQNDGCLNVMLDAPRVPNEAIADFIQKGLLKLNVEPVYDVTVYGRKQGEHFATWSQTFALKPRPIGQSALQDKQTSQLNSAAKSENRGLTITISTDDGSTKILDLAQAIGILGVAILLLGIFCPMITIPMRGTLTYFRGGHLEAITLIGLALASAYCLLKKRYAWLYGPGLGAFVLVGLTFYYFYDKLSELKSNLDRELSGNPFRGIADLAMSSTQLQWGWILLFLGSALILSAARLRQRKLTRQAFVAMGVTLAAIVALPLLEPAIVAIQYQQTATSAKQSVAKMNIGSINRGQQAYFLESNKFSPSIDDLELGISSETTDYKYQIVTAEKDLTVATATAKDNGLKSYTGAVSSIQVAPEETSTITIVCEGNSASKTPPSTPTLRDNQLQCPNGSVDLSSDSK